MNLKGTIVFPGGDVADETHEWDAVEQQLPEPVARIVEPPSRHNAKDTRLACATGPTIGHTGGGEFMRGQDIPHTDLFEGVPKFVFLGARDSEHAATSLGEKNVGDGLGAGH